jgi:fatty acid-binding protein DegV
MLYHVVHEDLEDEEGELVVSLKAYPEKVAAEKAEALAEKYPNAYCDIMSIEDYYTHQHLTKPNPLS